MLLTLCAFKQAIAPINYLKFHAIFMKSHKDEKFPIWEIIPNLTGQKFPVREIFPIWEILWKFPIWEIFPVLKKISQMGRV